MHARDGTHRHAVHLCAEHGKDPWALEILRDAGASLDARVQIHGQCPTAGMAGEFAPLHVAVFNPNPAMAGALIRLGADPYTKVVGGGDARGMTAFDLARTLARRRPLFGARMQRVLRGLCSAERDTRPWYTGVSMAVGLVAAPCGS